MSRIPTYLVEDSPVIRDNLVATLEELSGVQVVATGEDETSAVKWLSQHKERCQLVIIDIFLKSGSGLGVLREARKIDGAFVLVVLSNYATADMRRTCASLGADRVFDKSNQVDELLEFCAELRNT